MYIGIAYYVTDCILVSSLKSCEVGFFVGCTFQPRVFQRGLRMMELRACTGLAYMRHWIQSPPCTPIPISPHLHLKGNFSGLPNLPPSGSQASELGVATAKSLELAWQPDLGTWFPRDSSVNQTGHICSLFYFTSDSCWRDRRKAPHFGLLNSIRHSLMQTRTRFVNVFRFPIIYVRQSSHTKSL